MNNICKICLSKNLKPLKAQFTHFITSDCNKTDMVPILQKCEKCGFLQKLVDNDYLDNVSSLYKEYQIYNQGNNEEQLIFNRRGQSKSRSDIIFENIKKRCAIPKEGKLAEVGCGFGKFLKVFNKNFPDWYLHGFDLGDQYTDTINSIQNAKYYKNDFGISKEQYDLIIGIHLLEHVDDPLEFLNICKDRLAKNGLIFMQMPNITTSTFDLIIADHISHFSVKDITQLANSACLNVEFISDEIISKELFCIFSNSPKKIQNKAGNRKKDSGQIDVNLNILRTFEKFCQLENESVYIFGSSIGGSWLSRYFGKKSNIVH